MQWSVPTYDGDGSRSEEAQAFYAGLAVESRCALGWPAPGNGYWTEETIAAALRRWPGLDVTPYREAIPRL